MEWVKKETLRVVAETDALLVEAAEQRQRLVDRYGPGFLSEAEG